jgi:hypothetical protein
VAAWFPDMFCAFYSAKNHKIADNLATAEAKEKSAHFWNPLNFRKKIDASLTKFRTNQVLFIKICQQFLLTT